MIAKNPWRGVRAALVFVMLVLAALCSLEIFRWETSYSAWFGNRSEAQNMATAAFWIKFYVATLIMLEVSAIATVWNLLRLQDVEMSMFLRLLARFGLSVGVAVAGTGVLVAVIVGALKGFK